MTAGRRKRRPARRLCSIDGCGQRHFGRTWCRTHYLRWKRNGDPTLVVREQAEDGEVARFYQDVVLPYKGAACLFWPFARHKGGYARMWCEGKARQVHRRLCEDVNGPPPNPDDEAAHNCGNGTLGCVTGLHLQWKTHLQNEADKLAHGTRAKGEQHVNHTLTEPEVRQIRALEGSLRQCEIAKLFRVHPATVWGIHHRRNWAWLV